MRAPGWLAGGFTIVETIVATSLLSLFLGGAVSTLLKLNANASSNRLLTEARAIVQRNIDTAMGVPFAAGSPPAILAITGSGGAVWDDDGGGDNLVTIMAARDGTSVVRGTLRRFVAAEPNSASAQIRRVTFRIDYTWQKRPLSYSVTTIRAAD